MKKIGKSQEETMTPAVNRMIYWVIAFFAVALIGFGDSVYLTATHYLGIMPECSVIQGCDIVAMSDYSTIGPLPVSLFGVLFYAFMMAISVAWFDTRKPVFFEYLPFITVPAFLFSMWLIYVMYFVIGALCIYCLLSAATTTILMLFSIKLRSLTSG
ncbi:MAG: vitamin K epoxide reductase family protein [Balneolaceae bacterium]|nr:MAG: vitamin K epoxide reductase family protein [Balneolaceae bacterium]